MSRRSGAARRRSYGRRQREVRERRARLFEIEPSDFEPAGPEPLLGEEGLPDELPGHVQRYTGRGPAPAGGAA